MRKILLAAAAAAAITASAGGAHAATATSTFQVSATVLKACTVSAAPLAFGNYTPGAGPVSASTTISVDCTSGTGYTVSLNGGTTTGGTVSQRLMANGTNTLQYNLYTNNTYSTILGDGTGPSVTASGTGSGMNISNSLTVYGDLPDDAANQAAVPGSYTDTIQVTVTY
ncbi:MAG TPA: spore coat U domain-containing protein [Steroidobacteraceae bacterium]|nr:spore coat U domain-containing protein [Steroidobacteraceae bacterium]